MVLKSFSKINLSLNINSKLKNGLHDIQSYYCLINLFDNLSLGNGSFLKIESQNFSVEFLLIYSVFDVHTLILTPHKNLYYIKS